MVHLFLVVRLRLQLGVLDDALHRAKHALHVSCAEQSWGQADDEDGGVRQQEARDARGDKVRVAEKQQHRAQQAQEDGDAHAHLRHPPVTRTLSFERHPTDRRR